MRRTVESLLRSGWPQLVTQLCALWLVSVLAKSLAAILPVPVPAGVVGMIVVFAALCSGFLRLAWIERGATLLVRHLGLFLVPYAVSIMGFLDLMLAGGIALLVAIIGSTVLGMAATGWTAQAAAQARIARSVEQ